MKPRSKKIGVLILSVAITGTLAAGAYAASGFDKSAPQGTIGKNWFSPGVIEPKAKPKPLKNLKSTPSPSYDEDMQKLRPTPKDDSLMSSN